MKTVPFSDILFSVCQIVGLDRNTLNDKSFSAIRDLCARRCSTIWDREEWPDTERRLRTYPGNPIKSITLIDPTLLTENYAPILGEAGYQLWQDNPENTITARLYLDEDFPRIYLFDFVDQAYQRGTIGSTTVSIVNPFWIVQDDLSRISSAITTYSFSYATSTDINGEYITSIDINIPFGLPEYPSTYNGPNDPLASKLIFSANSQLLVQLNNGAHQGLEAYSADPTRTTRATFQPFTVEDMNGRDDRVVNGTMWNEDYSYLRFYNSSEKFIKYRLTPLRLLGLKYDPFLEYSIGAQVYFDTDQISGSYSPESYAKGIRGNFWEAKNNVPLTTFPSNESDYWKMVNIPHRFKDYLINGITADFLRSEGRAEEGNVFDGLAEAAVQQQIDVLIRQQGQVQRMNMVYTY